MLLYGFVPDGAVASERSGGVCELVGVLFAFLNAFLWGTAVDVFLVPGWGFPVTEPFVNDAVHGVQVRL